MGDETGGVRRGVEHPTPAHALDGLEAISDSASRWGLLRGPTPVSETDLISALFRLVIIFIVLISFLAAGARGAGISGQVYLPTLGLLLLNGLLIASYWRRVTIRWIHPVVVALELYILALWMDAWGTFARNLFVVYYLPAIVISLRFGHRWGVPTALAGIAMFLLVVPTRLDWGHITVEALHENVQAIKAYWGDMLYPQFLPLVIVALITGFLTTVRERERDAALKRERILFEFRQRIELAREVQESILPPAPPQMPGYDVGATVSAADYAVGGGDFYDLVPLSDGRHAFCIVDIAGKTISGVAKLPLIKWGFRVCAEQYPDISEMIGHLNAELCRDLEEDAFVALFLGVLDGRTGELRYVNAGQVPPVLIHSPDVEALRTGGPALGISPAAGYSVGHAHILPGDLLIACTDGAIPSTRSSSGPTALDWIVHLARRGRDQGPQELAESIRAEVERTERGRYRDDLAVLVVKRTSA